jgi:hypothetical protein
MTPEDVEAKNGLACVALVVLFLTAIFGDTCMGTPLSDFAFLLMFPVDYEAYRIWSVRN